MPTLGNHAALRQAVDAVLATMDDGELIVVYNGPGHAAGGVRESLPGHPALHFTVTATPYGIAKANNHGFRESCGRLVVFIHDDAVVRQGDWLGVLGAALAGDPSLGMVGGSEDKYIDRRRTSTPTTPAGVKICDWSPTISMARRQDLAAGSLFDERYLVGLEDKDWALSFRRRGQQVGFLGVLHDHLGTKGSYTAFLEDRELLDYYSREGVRERYFLHKNGDVLDPAYVAEGWRRWGAVIATGERAGG